MYEGFLLSCEKLCMRIVGPINEAENSFVIFIEVFNSHDGINIPLWELQNCLLFKTLYPAFFCGISMFRFDKEGYLEYNFRQYDKDLN